MNLCILNQVISVQLYLFQLYMENPLCIEHVKDIKNPTKEYIAFEEDVVSNMFVCAQLFLPYKNQNRPNNAFIVKVATEFRRDLPVKFKKKYTVEWLLKKFLDKFPKLGGM